MADIPPPSEPRLPSRWWKALGEIALIVCVFYLSSAAPPPAVNEPHYLCRLRHAIDPGYCPGDLFLESPDAHKTFVLAFAWMTRFLPLPALAWVGRLATWIALAWAWRRLSWTVVPRPLFATLAAAIVVSAIAEGNFAGEWLVGGFEAKTIAYVFVLLGLQAWVLNKWNLTWVFFGVASAWHALVGGWSVVIVLALWVFGWRRQQPLVGMLPGLLIGGAISLVGVLPALALNAGQPAEVRREAAEIYVFERLPHHLAPLHKPAPWIAVRVGCHATVVALFVALLLARRAELPSGRALQDDPAGRVAQYAIGAMVLAMVGMVLELMLWNQPDLAAGLLRYYWFRLTDVAVPVGVALLWIALLADLLERRSKLAPALLTVMLLLSGYPIAQSFGNFLAQPVAMADASMQDVGDWYDVCQWTRDNTPADALFLTPRGNTTFKWHAERAEVVTYKDIPQDAQSLVKWRRRLYDVFKPGGNAGLDWVGSLGELGTPRIRELAGEYGVDYVLTTHDYPLMLPVAYANETYVVYDTTNDK